MSEECRDSEGRIPAMTPTRTLWLLSVVAVAAAGALVLATPESGTLPKPGPGPVTAAPFSVSGEVDQSTGVAAAPERPMVAQASAGHR